MSDTTLHRRISFPLLVLYGLGTMVGGGFYALVGKVVGAAGGGAIVAFLLSGLVAGVAGLAFAELSARYPSSAGESRYVLEGFGRPWLARATGWLVVLTGVVSAATLSVAFAGFLADLAPVPPWAGIVLVTLGLCGVALWGIGESVAVAVAITFVEVGGLLWALWRGRAALYELPWRWQELVPDPTWEAGWGVFLGAFLAFYAFVGFEDLVNLAEEVVDVETTLPRAILLSLALTLALYVSVSVVLLLGVDRQALVESTTPIALAVGEHGASGVAAGVISMFAGVNGALMQVVMAARVLYGMAGRGLAPASFAEVHPVRRTPTTATLAVGAVVLVLALAFPLESLAKLTSAVLLGVFGLVALSMARIVRREPVHPQGLGLPWWVGIVGALLCAAFLLGKLVGLGS